jgi:aspartyl-tRNA(Asn)/glutamyl-tRNA(Gln) amidotransferase subunit A
MSIPCGMVEDKPVGLQIIGNYFDEARILNAAHQYQQASDWHTQAPEGIA